MHGGVDVSVTTSSSANGVKGHRLDARELKGSGDDDVGTPVEAVVFMEWLEIPLNFE